METPQQTRKPWFKNPGILLIALAVILGIGLAIPSYRPIFLGVVAFLIVSIIIGVAVALILRLWHRYKPVSEEDVGTKRPLGLD